jgi:hypothetical protein
VSAASIARAANDPEFQARVQALAQKEIVFNAALGETEYGKQLRQGFINILPLAWPVAVDTEAAYEAALVSGRGAPGHDTDVIPDASITSAIVAHWPYVNGEAPPPP